MLPRLLTAAALAALLAPAAYAQDGGAMPPAPPAPPPAPVAPAKPAKHENKISDAAKAAFEAMESKLYNPVAMGLKEFTGKSAMTLEVPGMENMEGMPPMTVDFRVAFKAPEEFKIEASTDNPMLAQQTGSLKAQVEHLLRAGQGQMKPMQEEFDADLEE